MATSFKDPLYDRLDAATTERLGLPPGLLAAVRLHGERSNADQVSEDKARTVYQIIPATRKAVEDKYGIDPWLSPQNASLAAGHLLKESLERNRGDVVAAVSEYHGGTDRAAWGSRTNAYVNRVMTALPADVRKPQTGGRRLSEELGQQEQGPSLAKVFAAYAAGEMDPESAAELEADVAAGRVIPPRGAKVKEPAASNAVPQGVLDAYFGGKMTPEEVAEFKADVQAGRVQLPAGVQLEGGLAAQIPGQDGKLVPAQAAAQEPGLLETVGNTLKDAGKTALQMIVSPAAAAQQNSELKALGEAGLTTATGMSGGGLGMVGGALGGTAAAIADGSFGTPEAVRRIEQVAAEGAQALTFEPRTELGRERAEAVGHVMQQTVPVMPLTAEMAALSRATAAAAPAVQATGRSATAATREMVKAKVLEAAARRAEAAAANDPAIRPTPGTMGSVGAAGTDMATLRRNTAQELPVPVELTKGQATRDFEQLRFEQELAKDPNKGVPLRERFADQNQAILRNFDVWVDDTGAQLRDLPSVGDSVTNALRARAAADKTKVRVAYKNAEKAGEMEAPVNFDALVTHLNESAPDAAMAPLLNTARQWAIKYGIAEEQGGTLVPVHARGGSTLMNERPPGVVSLATAEKYRQMINRNTDYEPTNIRQATIIKGLIDEATEGNGGKLYREARAMRREYAERYENFGLARDLLNTKRGTNDARIAAEDVFRKSILTSSMADVKQLGRLLKTSEQGRQAWSEVQGAAVRHLQEQATKNVSRDVRGNEIVSPKGLDDAVKAMDRAGKLDYLFGKKGAEQVRAINDLSKYVYTTPPGAVNTSNTASVILAALDMATSGIAGMPLPVMSGIRILTTHVKDRQIQKRIREALGIKPEPKKVKAPQPIVPAQATSIRLPENRTIQ